MKDSFFINGDGKKIVFVLESYPFELSSNQYIYTHTHHVNLILRGSSIGQTFDLLLNSH
jgi:hypothetical protein